MNSTTNELARRAAAEWTLAETLRLLRRRADKARAVMQAVADGEREPRPDEDFGVVEYIVYEDEIQITAQEARNRLGAAALDDDSDTIKVIEPGVDSGHAHEWLEREMGAPPHALIRLHNLSKPLDSDPEPPPDDEANRRITEALRTLDTERTLRGLWRHLLDPERGDGAARLAEWVAGELGGDLEAALERAQAKMRTFVLTPEMAQARAVGEASKAAWASTYGTPYPDNPRDMMRQALRARVDLNRVDTATPDDLLLAIEGYRLHLRDQAALPSGPGAEASGAGDTAGDGGGEAGGAVPKAGGWTQSRLIEQAGDLGDGTFRRIRKAAGVQPSKRGAAGQQRHYAPDELRRMIEAAPRAAPQLGQGAAAKWRDLLPAERGSNYIPNRQRRFELHS